ncbi:Oidioi.mRNA.OKI2018_I69.XSR.g15180.t1.cds [Oikopleura dioica]|uniref:Oidioi.mRNA.OKI2018_I69.XSR.g15180.t1.cds n=1 Tax=Oikopleura dioica TaxID=34765 RepID=A0ABN7SC20_OIKDI|nr:Oidioi.mRNA.OKI2018_I69.XSR.g15180.t1.cds [Oikopleura dioica]
MRIVFVDDEQPAGNNPPTMPRRGVNVLAQHSDSGIEEGPAYSSARSTPFRAERNEENYPRRDRNNNNHRPEYAHRAKYEGERYAHREKYLLEVDEYYHDRCFPGRQDHFDEEKDLNDVAEMADESPIVGFYNQGTNRTDFLGLKYRHYFSFDTQNGHECIGSWMTADGHLFLKTDKNGLGKNAQPGDDPPENFEYRKKGLQPDLVGNPNYTPLNSRYPKRFKSRKPNEGNRGFNRGTRAPNVGGARRGNTYFFKGSTSGKRGKRWGFGYRPY